MKEGIIIRRYRIKANNSHSKLKISSSLTKYYLKFMVGNDW